MMEGTTLVYILQSISKPNRFYVGITLAFRKEKRLKEYNKGKTPSTRKHKPWMCIYTETYNTKSEAAKREYYFKSVHGYKERKIICEKYKMLCSVR